MSLPRYAPGPITLERRLRRSVGSFSAGTHYPVPLLVGGTWYCRDCGRPLRTYAYRGERRLRHYSGVA